MSIENGGAKRDRTADLKLAKLALSQLSYGPVVWFRTFLPGLLAFARRAPAFVKLAHARSQKLGVVGPGRVERPTSRLSGVRSNHLSYEPDEVFIQQRRARIGRARHSTERKGNEGGGKTADCLVSIEKRHERR